MNQITRMKKLWDEVDAAHEDAVGKRERRSCHYCGVGLTKRGTKEPRSATVDHIIPKSRGGNSSPINTVMCCRRCNGEKGNFTGVEYRAWIKAGRPNREVFKSKLPHFKHYYAAEDGTHFEWFKRLYIDKPTNTGEVT